MFRAAPPHNAVVGAVKDIGVRRTLINGKRTRSRDLNSIKTTKVRRSCVSTSSLEAPLLPASSMADSSSSFMGNIFQKSNHHEMPPQAKQTQLFGGFQSNIYQKKCKPVQQSRIADSKPCVQKKLVLKSGAMYPRVIGTRSIQQDTTLYSLKSEITEQEDDTKENMNCIVLVSPANTQGTLIISDLKTRENEDPLHIDDIIMEEPVHCENDIAMDFHEKEKESEMFKMAHLIKNENEMSLNKIKVECVNNQNVGTGLIDQQSLLLTTSSASTMASSSMTLMRTIGKSDRRHYQEQYMMLDDDQNYNHLERAIRVSESIKKNTINSCIILASDRDILLNGQKDYSSLKADTAAYGHDWYCHHKKNEILFKPWQMCMTGKLEKLRLGVISMYWNSATLHPVSPATIHVAINNLGRLLQHWNQTSDTNNHLPSAARWALVSVIAFRLAFKAEERPEVVWDVSNVWNLFPMFNEWDIDRSDDNMNKTELEALRTLGDAMDVPLSPMFLSIYLSVAGWPHDIVKDYHELGLYLLALTTFASSKDQLLRNIPPSKLAAAALVLAVKIVNGDRASPSGILKHLPNCIYASSEEPVFTQDALKCCICRYEFYPERLKVYSGLTLEELQPVVKGLSCLLRSKPLETSVLNHFYPLWADNDWQ